MSRKRIAGAVASVVAAPFALAFMLAYGAWCRRSYSRALRR